MIRWEQLDTAKIPDGGELKLMRRGTELSIMSGSIELMNSRLSGSEEALASLTCTPLATQPKPKILIGGLGMGFTLRAALAVLPPGAEVVVAELVPAVVAWARGPMAELFAGSLDDPRVSVRLGDVGEAIAASRGAYDAILLDVDNGPGGLNREANDGLYSAAGLATARAALRPGGVLAVWSAAPDAPFVGRLRRAGYAVDEKQVRATRSGKGGRHVIWLAARP
ncbi:spermidine synthase [Phenylobacterium sp. LjRoot225]|uniref:spermidine synthase n=1 Tax=Phenylobacterium sp. LjRoot225 TaxID=3342285 RepID=UPI003ECE1FC8